MLSRALSAHLTRNGAELHDRLEKLLYTPEMVKHGFCLFRYLDGVIENCLERVWRLMKYIYQGAGKGNSRLNTYFGKDTDGGRLIVV